MDYNTLAFSIIAEAGNEGRGHRGRPCGAGA